MVANTPKPTTPAQTKLPAGKPAEAKPNARTGQKRERKPLPDIPLEVVTTGRISAAEAGKFRPVNEGSRNATQRKLDADVKQAHTDWIAAGREHKEWGKMAPWTAKVPKAHEETIKAYLRKAGLYHDVQVRFGRTVELPDGLVAVTYVAKDRKPKEEATDESKDESKE